MVEDNQQKAGRRNVFIDGRGLFCRSANAA